MSQTKFWIFYLPWPGFALKLLIKFIRHSQSTCRQGMTIGLEATISIHRLLAIKVKPAGLNIVRSLPIRAEPEVFISAKLGDAKAVMHLGNVYLVAGIGYAGCLVSHPGGIHRFIEVGEVVVVA